MTLRHIDSKGAKDQQGRDRTHVAGDGEALGWIWGEIAKAAAGGGGGVSHFLVGWCCPFQSLGGGDGEKGGRARPRRREHAI